MEAKKYEIKLNVPGKKKGICSLLEIRDAKGRTIGKLEIQKKTILFYGNCDKAARAFFQAVKGDVTDYIKNSLLPKPESEVKAETKVEEVGEDESRLAGVLKTLNLKREDILAHGIRGGRVVIVTKNGKKFKV